LLEKGLRALRKRKRSEGVDVDDLTVEKLPPLDLTS
jgi:hypothetical protein